MSSGCPSDVLCREDTNVLSRYQQLELKHVFDKGVFPSRDFR